MDTGFPSGTMVKNLPSSAEDTTDPGSIPGSGRYPGGGNANPLQQSGLETLMDRGAWRATVHGVTKSQTRLSTRIERKSWLILVISYSKQ